MYLCTWKYCCPLGRVVEVCSERRAPFVTEAAGGWWGSGHSCPCSWEQGRPSLEGSLKGGESVETVINLRKREIKW